MKNPNLIWTDTNYYYYKTDGFTATPVERFRRECVCMAIIGNPRWWEENNMDTVLRSYPTVKRLGMTLIFHDKDEAMLFKLKWN